MRTSARTVVGTVVVSLLLIVTAINGKPFSEDITVNKETRLLELFEKLLHIDRKSTKSRSPLDITDVTNPVDTKTISECLIIVRKKNKSSSKAMKACWPFSRRETCPRTLTRDFSYNSKATGTHVQESLKDLVNGVRCGKNMFYHGDNGIESEKRELEQRIVGGVEAVAGQYPWMVSIGRASHGLSCGGTLVGGQWVLTAAHCFDESDRPCEYNIRVGSFNWGYDTEGHHHDIPASGIYRYPDYDNQTNDNDIAMIKLSEPVDLSPHSYINSICLPEQDQEYQPGKKCIAAGWGTLEEDGHVPMTLREVQVPLLSNHVCAHENMTNNQFCAGYLEGGKDTCQGDSGGPVMCQRADGRWYIQGVTSYGNGCAEENWPGVYTIVPHYTNWVKSVMSRFG